MGRSNKNTYAKALKHLKSTHEEVTYSMLDEAAPTNSTSGLYRLEPDEIIIDPNGADPVDFGEDPAAWEAMMQELLGDYVSYDGTDTSGLFEADGRIRTVEPPGDTSYVLGPMSAMWYSWGNFTQIGYIRQSDRRMVNLARITGPLGSWDGENDFTSYGQLTLEQAVWFRDVAKKDGADNDTPNYRAFYPGPPSNPADEYGRYLAVIVGESKPPAKTVRTGDHGSAQDAGFPWFNVPDSQLTPEQRRRRRQFDTLRSGITDVDSFWDAWARRWGGTEGPNAPNAPAEGKWWMSMMRLMDAGMSYDAASQALGLDTFLDRNFPDAGDTTRRGQGGRELGDTTRRGGEYDRLVNTPDSQLTPAERETKANLSLAQLGARGLRSATDNIRYSGRNMFQGNPAGRAPGLSNYWSPEPATAGTYSRSGNLKGVPGASPSPSGTLTTAPRPANAPRVTRSPLGQPQFKFPKGSPPPASMITQVADDAAVSAARVTASKTAARTIGRAVPILSAGIAIADAGVRISNGDYGGAILSGISAVPGPIGWGALGLQMAIDGVRGMNEEKEYKNFKEYCDDAREKLEQVGFNVDEIDRDAMLTNILREIARTKKLSNQDKKFFYAIITDAEGLKGDEVFEFVKSIQKKLISTSKNNSEVNESRTLSVIKNIKKPVTIKEVKQERIKRRPRVIGSKSESKTINSGLMKQAEVPTSFKKPEDRMWGKYEKMQNARASQERKNQVLDHLGGSDHAWQYLLERNASKRNIAGFFDKDGTPHTVTRKEQVNNDTLLFIADEKGKKESILQSDLNDKLDREFNRELFSAYFAEQETMQVDGDPLFKKVSKSLRKKIDYPDKPAKKGYPDKAPPKMVNGYHPEYGKDRGQYNKLDPISANSMPPTGSEEIDAKVKKARRNQAE